MDGWAALILAGGAGRRFGGGKLTAPLGGVPVIRQVADRVVGVGFDELLVVTGAQDEAIRAALAGLDVEIIHAPDWAEGLAASLRTGIAALGGGARGAPTGVCVFLGDMPLVPVGLCDELIHAADQAGYAARPRYQGKPGHPVVFTRAAFADLLALTGDNGATALLRQRADAVAYLDTADSGVLMDIDTPADLAVVARAWKPCATSATSDNATSRGALPKP